MYILKSCPIFDKNTKNLMQLSFKGVATGINSNWKFIVTSFSILSSLVSMGIVLTENYFVRPDRKSYKTKTRWILFFLRLLYEYEISKTYNNSTKNKNNPLFSPTLTSNRIG